jgi:hypothetical protein
LRRRSPPAEVRRQQLAACSAGQVNAFVPIIVARGIIPLAIGPGTCR